MPDRVRYGLVMPAAGGGMRFGGGTPKQHRPLVGSTVLETALRLFLEDTRCVAVALALADDDPERHSLRQRLPAKVAFAAGGAVRSQSVANGLATLAQTMAAEDWVLVHDAARPCLSAGDLRRVLDAGAHSRDGALLAAPMADTVKEADHSAHALRTVPRSTLWRALTPQMFRLGELRNALDAARAGGREATDEAQAMEWQGRQPLLVAAADQNPKVTMVADLGLAAAILASRMDNGRDHDQ